MKILVVGAGGIGGYFGGRLLAAGRDVTFLVRPRRRAELAERGLIVRSPHGDIERRNPPTAATSEFDRPFDLILLSCKSYDLADATESFAPAVGPESAILPLLNGMTHLDTLDERFGAERVLGGQCFISATLEDNGDVMHMNRNHTITFGERDGSRSKRIEAVLATFSGAGVNPELSTAIVHEMWEKWVFIATLAGITCLMRASIGGILSADGAGITTALLEECSGIAAAGGYPPRPPSLERARSMLFAPGSTLKASMLRDMERGARTEGEHVLGELLRLAPHAPGPSSLLRLAYTHVKSYEAARAATPAR